MPSMTVPMQIAWSIILLTVVLPFELTLCEEVPLRDESPPTQGFAVDAFSEASGQVPSTRELLQRRERRNCRLSRRERREILDTDRRWIVNSTVLESVNGDLQEIINCSSPDDIILLNLTEPLRPSSALVFRWNITLSAYTPDSGLENGVYPRSRTKTRMNCTNGESIISIRTDHVLLANLEFLNCRQSASGPAIVDVRNCTNGTGLVRFHHVRFFNNRHRSGGPIGIEFQKPSCYSSELIDVQFHNNTCAHRCLADLAPDNHLHEVEIIGNQWTRLWPLSIPAMIYIGSNNYSSFDMIRAVDNEGSVLWSAGGEVNLTNSTFEENTGGRTSNGRTFSAGITVQNATGLVRNISFVMNSAEAGAGMSVFSSEVQVEDSVFDQNAGLPVAGGLFITDESTVNLTNCSFMSNTADTNGGAILVNASSPIHIANSSFRSNRADDYGTLFVEESELFMDNCSFLQNSVNDSGAAVTLFFASANVSHSTFEENSAVRRGGAWSATESTVQILDSNFTRNTIIESGGAIAHIGPNNLTIANSTFLLNSGADGAAIFFNSPSHLNCSNSTFQENRASGGGGGILTGEFSIFEISNSTFYNNSATHGGGIKLGVHNRFHAFSSNFFSLNRDAESGCGIFADRNCSLSVDDCVFLENYARFGAGIRMVRESSLMLNNSWFENNIVYGNGAGVYSDEAAVLTVDKSTFLNNSADMGGGLFAFHSGEVNITDSVFRSNAATGNGGALNVGENGQLKLVNVSFLENNANFGAGLELGFLSRFNVSDSVFRGNSAGHTGGGVFVRYSDINITNSEFYENSAGEGCGAIFFERSNAIVQFCTISNNTAGLSGGGILTFENNRTDILHTVLSGNEAPMGGGLYLEDSLAFGQNVSFLDNKGQMGGAVDLNLSSSFLCRRCEFLRNSASEDGGAVFISSVGDRGLAYQFEDTRFEENEAAFGGAIHFIQDHKRNKDCSSRNVNCSFLAVTGRGRLVTNRASQAGGAFFSNNHQLIRYDCDSVLGRDLDFMEEIEFESLPLLTPRSTCPRWIDNSVQRRGYGDLYGTFADRVVLTLKYTNGTEDVANGALHYLNDTKSGVALPSMNLEAVDSFGAGPAIAQVKDLSASLSSPDGFFPGDIIQDMSTGVGNFSELLSFRRPRQYHLNINFTDESLENLTIAIQIRECHVGEEVTANGTFCQECNATSFNFNPSEARCQQCPDDADCTGSFISPNKGFWHQHPCSSHIQECLSTAACDYESRTEELANLTMGRTQCPDQEMKNYTEVLCKKGYKGVLCGSCEKNYGLSDASECQECIRSSVRALLVCLSMLWVLLLSIIAVRGGLSVHAATQSVASRLRLCEEIPSGSEMPSTEVPVNTEMVEVMVANNILPENLMQQRALSPRQPEQPMTPRQVAHVLNVTKWRCSEIFKITINYLQVIGIAVSIDNDWTQTVYESLRSTEALSGFASEASIRSIDCIFPNSSSAFRFVLKTAVSLVVPLVSVIVLCFFWMYVRMRAGYSIKFWIKRSTLSLLVVLYVSYIALTKTLIRILYCVEVYDSFDSDDSEDTSRYWAMDTSLKCYEGTHLVLTILFSLPLLLLLTILFPVLSACILVRFRNKESLKSAGVYETMGFMFRAYQEKYVYWESIILLRKAVLAVIVVFGYPLGGNLQGTLAASVLVLASYLHHVCSPFSSDFAELNQLEGLSLLISSLTFVVGFSFNNDRTSGQVRVMLTLFLVISNVGLFLYLATVFFFRVVEHMRACLGPDDSFSHVPAAKVIRAYFSLQASIFQNKIQTMANT